MTAVSPLPGANTLSQSRDTDFIRLQGVTKRFPVRKSWNEILRHPFSQEHVLVLNGVSLEIARGEFFGLLGMNGAGKTTLFRILSTLVLADSGSVQVAGLDAVRKASAIRGIVAPVIASERSLYWRLNARENLRLFAVLQRVPRGEVEGAIERVLGVVALADTANKMVGSFSSGMRQRLLIARALLGRPDVLLLDEPTRSLDPVSARDFRVFLRETIVREQGCTVLLATHDADDVWTLCDRVAVLHRGDVLAVDRTGDLRARVGDDVYSSWIRRSDVNRHAKIAPNLGVAVVSQGETPEQEWIEIVVEIERGTDGAANYLARLASEGIAIARLEKRAPDLAELIERVVRARGAAA